MSLIKQLKTKNDSIANFSFSKKRIYFPKTLFNHFYGLNIYNKLRYETIKAHSGATEILICPLNQEIYQSVIIYS